MPANPFDESLVQGVYDTPAEVDPQWIPTPPDPLAGPGNPQSPRRLVRSYVCFVLRYVLTLGGISMIRSWAVLPFPTWRGR